MKASASISLANEAVNVANRRSAWHRRRRCLVYLEMPMKNLFYFYDFRQFRRHHASYFEYASDRVAASLAINSRRTASSLVFPIYATSGHVDTAIFSSHLLLM